MTELPLVMLPSGLQPQSPAALRSQLVALVAASNPDYTANLPSSMIEDIASTDVGALIISDQFLVDLVNSITPYGANPFLLNQLGNLYGVQPDEATNTSVYVQFSGPPPGFLISKGFVIGDGTYQYYCQEGSVIGSGGMSPPVFAVAGITGSWSIPPGTVTQVITSVPAAYTLNVTNPEAGTPAVAAETVTQFRTRVQRAGLAASTGMTRYLKTLCANIQGVQDRLVSVQQDTQAGKWIVLVGGGDPYEVGAAINAAVPDVTALTGSTIRIIGITNTNPAVITTENNHNLLNGQVYTISQVQGMLAINGSYAVTDISKTTFSVPFNATTQPAYTLGGVVTPNPINITVSIIDYPNTYPVSFINPFPQHVALVITWTTNSPNYISEASMAQSATPAVVDYINGLYAGLTPINLIVLRSIFIAAVASITPPESLVEIAITVSIDGIGTLPGAGTDVVSGDPYSYFYTTSDDVVVLQA